MFWVLYNRLTDEERIILDIEALEREVNNEGYARFFVNSSKEFAPIIIKRNKERITI
jgi:hypothetical protein